MAVQQFYTVNGDEGVSRESSHPAFVQHFSNDLYYDITDDFAPFGNDEGADALMALEEWYEKTKGKKDILKWMYKFIDEFGFEYASKDCAMISDPAGCKEMQEEDPFFLDCLNNTVLAVAFGQIKIAGIIDPELKKVALSTIQRIRIMTGDDKSDVANIHLSTCNQMEADLKAFG